MNDELMHYGTPFYSGRYPWGSGETPYQRYKGFLGYVDDLKKQGLTDLEISKGLDISTTQLRNEKSLARANIRKMDFNQALKLKDKGYSNVAIGKKLGMNESSVRSLLNPALQARSEMTETTANILKESIAKQKFIDVGVGVERHMGISRTKLKTSLAKLKDEGYNLYYINQEQLGTGKITKILVLASPEIKYGEVAKNKEKIGMVMDHTADGGRSYRSLEPIKNIDSKKIDIKYNSDKDGVIEIRPGAENLSLGNKKYAQVRIGVDGTHYLKGMAIYNEKLPDNIDILFNTNKNEGTPKTEVFKPMKNDPDNPFGTQIKPGGQKGALNIVYEEGDWGKWSKNLSSQMLSKQSPSLAKNQLGLAFEEKKREFDEIMSLTNPTIKKKLLEAFADDCDSSAVHLKAAAMPRQSSHVILPVPELKDTEIYAPNFRNGEKVVLIRYPHGGIFEIPQLTVNNKNPIAKKSLGRATDAVGISPKTASILSGADFDGDTVLVIPNANGSIKTSSPLKDLKDFDPKIAYPGYEGMPKIKPKTKQTKMGDVSNLITDMTIKGATEAELAKAVRHSMVIIDAEKHNLDYKQSYIDNGIAALKTKYQGGPTKGASTLISRASSETRVDWRKDRPPDPETGEKRYEIVDKSFVGKEGKIVTPKMKSTKMAEVKDAFELSSGTRMETVYANHANKLKALGNTSRKTVMTIKPLQYSPSAKETYAKEVASLQASLNIALKNAPLERKAHIIAETIVKAKKEANPDMDNDDIKKVKGLALIEARARMGANKHRISISDKEWEAIQAGAISNNTLIKILNNTDLDKVKMLATPRSNKTLSASQENRIKSMLASGKTQSEIADALGVSTSTVSNIAIS